VYEVTSEGLRAVSLGNVWYSVDGGTVKIVNLDTSGRYIDLPAFFGPVITGEQRAMRARSTESMAASCLPQLVRIKLWAQHASAKLGYVLRGTRGRAVAAL
jgi:hypothetical protein